MGKKEDIVLVSCVWLCVYVLMCSCVYCDTVSQRWNLLWTLASFCYESKKLRIYSIPGFRKDSIYWISFCQQLCVSQLQCVKSSEWYDKIIFSVIVIKKWLMGLCVKLRRRPDCEQCDNGILQINIVESFSVLLPRIHCELVSVPRCPTLNLYTLANLQAWISVLNNTIWLFWRNCWRRVIPPCCCDDGKYTRSLIPPWFCFCFILIEFSFIFILFF